MKGLQSLRVAGSEETIKEAGWDMWVIWGDAVMLKVAFHGLSLPHFACAVDSTSEVPRRRASRAGYMPPFTQLQFCIRSRVTAHAMFSER